MWFYDCKGYRTYELEAISISTSLLLTAQIEAGQQVQIHPLSATGKGNATIGLPSLRQVQEARSVRLRVIDPSTEGKGKGKALQEKDWLPLLLRESLVDLKYITPTQIVEVVYEGRRRRFTISSVSSQSHDDPKSLSNDGISDLSNVMKGLELNGNAPPQ
ncbi:hypothetical protein MPER_14884, partial [Moniliophthora perniciosa FA553]